MRISGIIFLTAALAACSSGSNNPPPSPPTTPAAPQTGNLTGVKGVAYRTATQSGITGDNGSFNYMPGEMVTFSLGGTTIAEVAATGTISPNAFLNLPTTEVAIRRELSSINLPSDFSRAFYVSQLMMIFDNDHNLSNGIDLGDFNTRLSGETFNLNQSLFDIGTLFDLAERFNLTAAFDGRDQFTGLYQLYRLLGITVPVHANKTAQRFGTDRETPTVSTEFSYDERGNLSRQVVLSNKGTNRFTSSYQYNERNQRTRLQEVTEQLSGETASTTRTRTTTRSYNDLGQLLVERLEDDINGDGSRIQVDIRTNSYNANNRLIGDRREIDNDNDGTFERLIITTTTFNDAGQSTSTVLRDDRNNDGTIDNEVETLREYNAQGQRSRTTVNRRTNGTLTRQDVTDVTIEVNGDTTVTTDVQSTDRDGDGTIDSRTTTIRTVVTTANGERETRFVIQRDTDADGSNNNSDETQITYNDQGLPLSRITLLDNNFDGTTNNSRTRRFTYDTRGRQLTSVDTRDNGHDGDVDSMFTRTREFNDFGATSDTGDNDSNGDGRVESQTRTTTQFNETFGYPTQREEFRTPRFSENLNLESTDLITIEVEQIPDGLQYLFNNGNSVVSIGGPR